MSKPVTFDSERRPPHIRYFEFLQIAMIGIEFASHLTVGPDQLLFNLATLGPINAVILGLTLAVSRGRQNWARWALLILYVVFVLLAASTVAFLFRAGSGIVLVTLLFVIVPGAVLFLAFTKQSSAWIHSKHQENAFERPVMPPTQQQTAASRGPQATVKIHLDQPGVLWALSSGAGAAVGAWIACLAFPSARFAQNPIGHFSWALVGFASTVGAGFGIAQSAALAYVLKLSTGGQNTRTRVIESAWIIATALGVFAMIFPLWWTYAEALVLAPGYMLAVMAPGIVLLAVLQSLLIRPFGPPKGWLWRTAVGGGIGASMGLFAAMMIGAVLPLPMEAAWAGSFGLVIGAMQAKLIQAISARTGGPAKDRLDSHNLAFPAQPV